MDPQIELLLRRLERERLARKQAEKIVEERSRELFARNEELKRLSATDPLTGLHNRRHFGASARIEFQRALRFDLKLSAIMMDVDHFKRVNDRFGHAMGDTVLVEVAGACKAGIRLTDLHARYGGEEFCFLLPETDLDGARILAERLRTAVSGLPFVTVGETFTVTASFGVADRLAGKDSIEDLLERSDKALYEAKKEGRDRVVAWKAS